MALLCSLRVCVGYYFESADGSSDRALFEMQQAQLEKFTDELQGLLEQPLEELMKPEMRIRMLSFTATIGKFRKGVMEAVEASNEARGIKKAAAEGSAAAAASTATTKERTNSAGKKKPAKGKAK